MNTSDENLQMPEPQNAHKMVLRRALRLGLLIWPLATVVYWISPLPISAPWAYGHPPDYMLDMIAAIPALAFPVFSLALIASILSRNRLPTKTLFKPSRARILGALGLWLIMPMISFGMFILSAGYIFFGRFLGAEWSYPSFVISTALFFACYAVACLLSSGLPSRWPRFAAYCLFWWAVYLSLILLFGLYSFPG